MNDARLTTQALVIGSGIAGCSAALTLADEGFEVILLSSGPALDTGNTALAQGGIVFHGPDEDPRLLEQDIKRAGHDYNYSRAVRFISRKGPQAVQELLVDRLDIPFARGNEPGACEWDLRLEGGHQEHRILYCADYTGRAIMDGLMAAVEKSPNIRVLTNRSAIDLLTSHHHPTQLQFKYHLTNQCVGAYVLNEETSHVETILADFTVLATGGVGQVYLHTTNTATSTGSGLTMAYRAGAWCMNTEFVQFHPTALYHRAERRFLISEAMRGDGARLVDSQGVPFMDRYDPRADLAPRDIVTRAILDEMLHTGEPCVYLDAARFAKPHSGDLKTAYPTIYKQCAKIGIDIEKDPIPVVPAAHYFVGGVLCDIHGRTTLDRLYAVGETACTGVHGANRLASTSLLEGLLWGRSAGADISRKLSAHRAVPRKLKDAIPDWNHLGDVRNEDPALVQQDWSTIRHTMWNYVGIARTTPRLARAADDMRSLYRHLLDFYKRTPLSKNLVSLFHGCHTAYIITMAAHRNKRSIGTHYRVDE
ncbi:L-aspartate oxidase [Oceanidesulfovibrio marinus]|uniref:L-aspartate oxidase n=1 Tax=Oceanidesulfovibrio marinus TaxID=370038 RepID=A0A6P1ZLT6_9BACT|nr:L-aspartate oxidase [Oceanidesulfovibrio marinus]TVM34879.1 L-aspartate oxidase [Oceanidesulfovibrio marinus]